MRVVARAAKRLLDRIDSVYLFMWPGWRTELRSNRWHFARRWARLRPVVMIQPELPADRAVIAEPEPLIENCQVLSVAGTHDFDRWVTRSLLQAAQIGRFMTNAGHRRPLFWAYNPYLLVA